MTTTKRRIFRHILSLLLAIIMSLGMMSVTAFAEETPPEAKKMTGEYAVSIKSLVSAAPLPAVQTAFAKAFGNSVKVTISEDETKTALIKNHHMVIENMMGQDYDANVASIIDADASTDEIEAATVLSTKQEVFTNGLGSTEQKEITVPDEFTIPLNLNEKNEQKLSITVDFMDVFLGQGKPYPTTVTLTLDMENAAPIIDVTELEALIGECETLSSENYTEESFATLTAAIEKAKSVAADPGTLENLNAMIAELENAKKNLQYKGADYSAVNAAVGKIPSDGSIYTDES